jgi:hypothetical protein
VLHNRKEREGQLEILWRESADKLSTVLCGRRSMSYKMLEKRQSERCGIKQARDGMNNGKDEAMNK